MTEDLLTKYMRHVRQCEGADFTDRLNEKSASEVEFTTEEVETLKAASADVHKDLWQEN